MTAVAESLFKENSVSISTAQRDTRISRLLHTFEECQSTLDQLRDLPEVTALLETLDSTFPCNESSRKSGDATVSEQRGALSCQLKTWKTDEAYQDTATCRYAKHPGARNDVCHPVSSKQESKQERKQESKQETALVQLTSKNTNSCHISALQNHTTHEARRAVGAGYKKLVGQNQHRFQELRPTSVEQSSHLDPVDAVTEIRIVSVESLSMRGMTDSCVDAAIQPVLTAKSTVDRDVNTVCQPIMSAVRPLPSNYRRPASNLPYPANLVSTSIIPTSGLASNLVYPANSIPTSIIPPLHQGVDHPGSTYSSRPSHHLPPPLLQYFPSQVNRESLNTCGAQQTTSPDYLSLPSAFRPAVSRLDSLRSPARQQLGNLCPPIETNGPGNWRKRCVSETLTRDVALKIVSYGSVRVSRYESELNMQALPLVKRPRYEAYAVK